MEKWLKGHPGVSIVSRDRSSVYAQAIGSACPQATQVADRWHLLKNPGENTARYLDRQRTLLKEAAPEVSLIPPPPDPEPVKAFPHVTATLVEEVAVLGGEDQHLVQVQQAADQRQVPCRNPQLHPVGADHLQVGGRFTGM